MSTTDRIAVAKLADSMCDKLQIAADKGRSGWDTAAPKSLAIGLRVHLEKGDPVDVANYLAFLHYLGRDTHGEPMFRRGNTVYGKYDSGFLMKDRAYEVLDDIDNDGSVFVKDTVSGFNNKISACNFRLQPVGNTVRYTDSDGITQVIQPDKSNCIKELETKLVKLDASQFINTFEDVFMYLKEFKDDDNQTKLSALEEVYKVMERLGDPSATVLESVRVLSLNIPSPNNDQMLVSMAANMRSELTEQMDRLCSGIEAYRDSANWSEADEEELVAARTLLKKYGA